MGRSIRGVACVTLDDVVAYSKVPVILGVDSALAYHGLGTDLYTDHPVFVTDKLPAWKLLKGEPTVVGVEKIRETISTKYPMLLVTNIVDSLLDTMQYNKYSEHITLALADIEDDEELMSKVIAGAKERGIMELLNWEIQEMREYFR